MNNDKEEKTPQTLCKHNNTWYVCLTCREEEAKSNTLKIEAYDRHIREIEKLKKIWEDSDKTISEYIINEHHYSIEVKELKSLCEYKDREIAELKKLQNEDSGLISSLETWLKETEKELTTLKYSLADVVKEVEAFKCQSQIIEKSTIDEQGKNFWRGEIKMCDDILSLLRHLLLKEGEKDK
jgi:hypothetical protein